MTLTKLLLLLLLLLLGLPLLSRPSPQLLGNRRP
jgi:hypothetical protein